MDLTNDQVRFLRILADGKKKTYVHVVKGFGVPLTPMSPTFTNNLAKPLLKLKLIKRAGGLTNFANPDAAVFMRADLRAREQEQLNLMRQQLQDELASLALEQAQAETKKTESAATLRDLSTQFEKVKPTGRLVIDLPAIIAGNDDADVVLKDNDTLVIPAATQEVTVIGEVFHPTSHLYQADLDRDDYINKSGGLTNKADDKRIYVVRANGSVLASSGSAWFSRNQEEIKPGDTIVVPMDVERLRPLTLWTSVS